MNEEKLEYGMSMGLNMNSNNVIHFAGVQSPFFHTMYSHSSSPYNVLLSNNLIIHITIPWHYVLRITLTIDPGTIAQITPLSYYLITPQPVAISIYG